MNPRKSAAIAGLKYVGDQVPGLRRLSRGTGFRYVDPEGRAVRDKARLERIRSLVIPPALTKVWICPDPLGHLQAVGYDARGRKQYRYHPDYRTLRDHTKFEHLPETAAAVAVTRQKIRDHLSLSGVPREKVLAAVIRLIDVTSFRIGNQLSATENKTFGVTTLRNQHVEVDGSVIRFRFTGKSGVKHEVKVTDRRLARIVRQCHDLPGHQLFEYVDEAGKPRAISSTDVNAYLKEVSGENLTAKDFRTWTGTVECAVALRDLGEATSETEAKRNIVAAIKTAAERLGNRAATCRAYYVHPAIPKAYLAGGLLRMMQHHPEVADGKSLSAEERCVLKIIQEHHFSVAA